MHAATWLLLVLQLAAAQPTVEGLIDGILRNDAVPVSSPAPEPEALKDADQPLQSDLLNAALALVNNARKEVGGAFSVPLEEGHQARALSHSGNNACSNDCPNVGNVGSVTNDGYCDDGAPSIEYCQDPSGSQYQCTPAVTNWCPFGHDCADCGPRKVTNVCSCCGVRVLSRIICLRCSCLTARRERCACGR